MIEAGVIEAARELLEARNYSSVVAVATETLDHHPECVEMRLLRANALMALRRDDEAQLDLRECLRRKTRCADAYRLLGELCFRRDEFESAAVFLREANRLEPDDQHARDLLTVVYGLSERAHDFVKPTAAVEKLPAATAAVGPLSSSLMGAARRRATSSIELPRPRRIAKGTCAPELFETTEVDAWPVPAAAEASMLDDLVEALDEAFDELTDTEESADNFTVADPPDPYVHAGLTRDLNSSSMGESVFDAHVTSPESPRAERRAAGSSFEGSARAPCAVDTVDGEDRFARFLVRIGALTPAELGHARRYQRGQRRPMSLGEVVVTLGYASEPTVVTAALAFRAEQLARA